MTILHAQDSSRMPFPPQDPSLDPDTIRAEVLRDLLDKGLLTHQAVSQAVLKLRLDVTVVAKAFGYDEVKEFLAEFVTEADTSADAQAGFEPWSLEDMLRAADARFLEKHEYREIAQALRKTQKSVSSWFRRTFRQGNTVNKAVWDLLTLDRYTAAEVAEVASIQVWQVEFAEKLYRLHRHCDVHHLPLPVITFDDR